MTTPREDAIKFILVMLRSPLAMISRPDREEAILLATQFEISAKELLEMAYQKARNR